jgi:hypothetical protein
MKYFITLLLLFVVLAANAQTRLDSLAVNIIKPRSAGKVVVRDTLLIQSGSSILRIQPKSDSIYFKSNKPISIAGVPTKKALGDTTHNLRIVINTKYAGLPDQVGHTGHFLSSNGLSESWQAVPRNEIRTIKLTVSSNPQSISFDTPFAAGSDYVVTVNCYNSEGAVWFLITNRNESGFTLKTEISSLFECICIKK